MAADFYTGSYGLVVIPDTATIEESYRLAKQLYGDNADYVLTPGYLPHITLYHSRYQRIPATWIHETLEQLRESLTSCNFALNSLTCFGERMIFWNLDPNCPDFKTLLSAHEKSLELVKYLDQNAVRRSDEEGVRLSSAELENSRIYNHPLVREQYSPHITLGYDTSSPNLIDDNSAFEWEMTIDRVVFVEIGHPGVVLAEVC